MSYFRLVDVARQFLDDDGAPLAGGKLYTYEAGTVTNKATYEDDAGAAAHTNPIILDSSGRVPAEVFGTTGAYKLRLDDADDVTLWTRDNILGANDFAASGSVEWILSPLTPTRVGDQLFSIPGDQTTDFHVGRRVRWVDQFGTHYATIFEALFDGTKTTVDLIVDSDDIGTGLVSVSYGFISRVNTSVYTAQVRAGTYTGNGATSFEITGLGFRPLYVKIWPRVTTDATTTPIYETTSTIVDDNGSGMAFVHVAAGGHTTRINGIIALAPDSFTVDDGGTDAHPNTSGAVYNYLAIG